MVLASEALRDETQEPAALRARLCELDAWTVKSRSLLDAIDKPGATSPVEGP
jgi:hypothetical protein